jgi:glucan phosphoethanolaminetransferase (alkaline phosphatase superfamily)
MSAARQVALSDISVVEQTYTYNMLPGSCLAYAESVDPTNSNLSTVLTCAVVVLVMGVVALVPVMMAWSRRHRRSDAIMAVAILWGLLASVIVASAVLAKMKFSHEHLLLIQSGYYDPNDVTDVPKLPWLALSGLTVGYVLLLIWPLVKPRDRR